MGFSFKKSILLFSVTFAAVSCLQKSTGQAALPSIKLTEDNSGKTVNISKGQLLILTLSNKVDGGYVFNKEQADSSVLKLQRHLTKPSAADGRMGKPGQDTWQFKALKKGTTILKVTASRPWTKKDSVDIFSITVKVK